MLTIADWGSSRIGSINESPDGSAPLRLRSTRTYGVLTMSLPIHNASMNLLANLDFNKVLPRSI